MTVLRFNDRARADAMKDSEARPGRWPAPTGGLLALCLAAAICLLASAAPAWAGCPQPQGTHFQGTYEAETSGGFEIGSGTFDSISKELAVVGPGELSFNATTEFSGTYFGKQVKATGVVKGGLLRCEGGVGIEEIPLEEQSGTIEGFGEFKTTGHAKGTFTATEISGAGENVFGEKTRYTGVFDPKGGSAGVEPGDVEVISPFGTVASAFTVEPASGAQVPAGTVAPAGALGFSVSGVTANGTIKVLLVLPPGSTPTAVYKPVGGGVYEEYPASKTELLGNVIVLELTDNESPWDEDPTEGVIRDPAVPVQVKAAGTAPSVTKLSLKKGAAGAETAVTITGSEFTGATAVRFGTAEAASFTVNSSTSITAVTPKSAAPGKVPVFVASGAGVSTAAKKAQFTFKKPKKTR